MGYLKDMRERRRAVREVDTLSPRDLEEVGLTRGELRELVQTPGEIITRQMEMAFRHGLTDRDFAKHRHDYAAMVLICRDCRSVDTCRHFLAAPNAPLTEATFCPNAESYRDLAGLPPE